MKTLYLLRHAKTEAGTKDISDTDRILTSRGRDACAQMGAYMLSRAYLPERAMVSPAARTRETFALISAQLAGIPPHDVDEKLYLASAETILRCVQKADDAAASLLVVGHNPGMHHCALTLARADRMPERVALELKYPTCTLSVLTFPVTSWHALAPEQGTLACFMTPDDL